MNGFLEYKTPKGKRLKLLPHHIRGLEELSDGTRIYASIAGMAISFQVKRKFEEVDQELERAREAAALTEG